MVVAEALFRLLMFAYGRLAPGVASEAFSITYIHTIYFMLEIIVSCTIFSFIQKEMFVCE
jgi:hypothetical protein